MVSFSPLLLFLVGIVGGLLCRFFCLFVLFLFFLIVRIALRKKPNYDLYNHGINLFGRLCSTISIWPPFAITVHQA